MRLLLQASKHVDLRLLGLSGCTTELTIRCTEPTHTDKAAAIHLLLLWLLGSSCLLLIATRVKGRGPLVGLIRLWLRLRSHHVKLASHTIVLLLLLERAVEELRLETAVAWCLLLLHGVKGVNLLLLLLLLLKLLLLEHLHLLKASLLLLLWVVEVGHGFEGSVFNSGRVSLWIRVHDFNQIVNHVLLLVSLLLLLLRRLLLL